MAELIISSNAPCCPPKGTLWRNPITKSLKLLDLDWEPVTCDGVRSVNGKTGEVQITIDEILGRPDVLNSVYTSNGWGETVSSAIKGSKSLITSGGVFSELETVNNTLSSIQAMIGQGSAETLKKSQVETSLSNLSTDNTVPSSSAVVRFVSSRTVQGAAPVVATQQGDATIISVKAASPTDYGIVRYATMQDWNELSESSVVTPYVIKPLVNALEEHIERLYEKLREVENEIGRLNFENGELKREFYDYRRDHP